MKLSLFVVSISSGSSVFGFISTRINANKRKRPCLYLTTVTQTNNGNEPLLSQSVFSTIEEGKIAVVPNFIPHNEITPLRTDAQNLWDEGKFSTDALAGYGSTGKFDPAKDRAVLRLPQWKNDSLGNFADRQRFGSLMSNVRSELAYNLNRPNLDKGAATTMYGKESTEISYTRFGTGAFLKRHVGELALVRNQKPLVDTSFAFGISPHTYCFSIDETIQSTVT